MWRAVEHGILTGALLAFARISGETAPLLFTALNNQFLSWNMDQAMANLPMVIFSTPSRAYDDLQRWLGRGRLMIALRVLAVNIIARTLAGSTDAA